MLDSIKLQLKKKELFVRMNSYLYHRPNDATIISHDFYPFYSDYFHEMNPAFVANVTNIEIFNLFPAVTVRDGSVVLANWLVKNLQVIPTMKTHFFIHQNQARLLPPSLKSSFSCWTVVQPKKITPQQAKRVLLLGILNDVVLDLKEVEKILKELGEISKDIELEIFIPHRRNPYSIPWNESNIIQELVELIKKLYPENKLKFLKVKDILDSSNWSGTYVVDLFHDSTYLSDSYVNHAIAARGGTISTFASEGQSNSLFEMDLSLHHKIQYFPLPEAESIFADLIFYKKQTSARDLSSHLSFHALLKKKDV